MLTMEQGIKEIMAIIGEDNDNVKIETAEVAGGAHVPNAIDAIDAISTVNTVSPANTVSMDGKSITPSKETVYDGYGHILSVNGKSTSTGYKKGAKRVNNAKDTLRKELLEAMQVVIERVTAFQGKTGWNSVEGLVVRMADADYTVKCGGHAKREFENREPNFIPEKNFITRGKAVNHTPAIAKILISEIENEFSNSIFENKNQFSVALLSATASTIRFEISNSENKSINEFSFKITKKRTRIVLN